MGRGKGAGCRVQGERFLLFDTYSLLPIPYSPEETFLINSNIGIMNAILVSLVVCVHINSIFGIDCGEYKICS